MNSTNHSIKLRGLVKRYGERTVVNGVIAEVGTGEVVGLLGPNGAGKTTTFYMVVGLVKPDGGTVAARHGDDEDRSHVGADVRARAQRHRLSRAGELDLSQALGRRQHPPDLGAERRPARRTRAAAARAARRVRTCAPSSTRAATAFRAASAGASRSRARSRSNRRFLLLDEPFTGIDPIAVADIQAMIRQLRDRGLGILITDHQVRETLAIVDRAYIMNNGRIEVSGIAQEVLDSPIARTVLSGRRLPAIIHCMSARRMHVGKALRPRLRWRHESRERFASAALARGARAGTLHSNPLSARCVPRRSTWNPRVALRRDFAGHDACKFTILDRYMLTRAGGAVRFGVAAFTLIFAATEILNIGKLVSNEHAPLWAALLVFLWSLAGVRRARDPDGAAARHAAGDPAAFGRQRDHGDEGGRHHVRADRAPLLAVGIVMSFVTLFLQESARSVRQRSARSRSRTRSSTTPARSGAILPSRRRCRAAAAK